MSDTNNSSKAQLFPIAFSHIQGASFCASCSSVVIHDKKLCFNINWVSEKHKEFSCKI